MRARQVAVALIILHFPSASCTACSSSAAARARRRLRDGLPHLPRPRRAACTRRPLPLDPRQWCGLPALAGGETTGLYPPNTWPVRAAPVDQRAAPSYWLHSRWRPRRCDGWAQSRAARGARSWRARSHSAATRRGILSTTTTSPPSPTFLPCWRCCRPPRRNSGRWWALLALGSRSPWLPRIPCSCHVRGGLPALAGLRPRPARR